MATDPYASFATPVGASSQDDPYASFASPVADLPPAQRRAAPVAAPQAAPVVAVEEVEDLTPLPNDFAMAFGPDDMPGTQNNPINTALMSDDAKLALTPGQWIVGPDGAARQLSGAPERSPVRPGDIQGNGQNFRERGGEGYNAALTQEAANAPVVDFASQPTAPLNDELAWLVGYGKQGASNLLDRALGRDSEVSALGRANAMRDVYSAAQDKYEADKPIRASVGQILGGFAAGPVAGARTAIGGRIAQAGASGAAYGAAEGDGWTDRGVKGLLGGALGVGTAGLLEGVGAGVGAISRGIRSRSLTPEARAEERVGGFLARTLRRDNRSLVDVERRLSESPNLLPFEAGGRNLAATAEAAASVPGRAQTAIGERLAQRTENATSRIRDTVSREVGGTGNFFADLDDSLAARAAQARTGMDAFGDSPIALNADAQTALVSPRVRTAIADSAENLLSSIDPIEREAGERLARLAAGAENGVMPAGMTVRDAQDISRALNEASSSAWANGDGARGKVLGSLGRAIRQNARDEVPAYNAWLREYSDASSVMDASRLGFSIFEKASERNPVSARQLERAFSDMSQMEKDAFRKGVGEQLIERAGTSGGVTAMRALARGPEYGARVRVAFPDDASFERFLRTATDEIQMQNSANQVLGGSRTAPRAAAMDDLSQANGIDTGEMFGAVGEAASGNIPGLLARIGRGVSRRIPNTGTNIIGNEATNEVLGEALIDPAVIRRLLQDAQVREILAGQSPAGRLRALGGPGVVGAGSNALNPIQ